MHETGLFLLSNVRNVCILIGVAEGDTSTTNVQGDVDTCTSRTQPRKGKNVNSRMKIFGVELSPDNVAVAMVYFVQGVLGLARLAVSFYLKDDLHLDPAEVSPCYVLQKTNDALSKIAMLF